MPVRKSNLDRIQIPKPCPVEWNRMTGNEQIRHCQQCNKQVYNLSKMTRSQAEALVSASRGKLCAQFTRRADGTIITEEARPALHLSGRRASPVAAAIVTVILGISGSATPIAIPQAASSISSSDEAGAKKPEGQPQTGGGTSSLSGVITDPAGAVIAGAVVTLTNSETSLMSSQRSSDEGQFTFSSLEPGAYILRTYAPGFVPLDLSNITVTQDQKQSLDLTLDFSNTQVGWGGLMIAPVEPLRILYQNSELIVVARAGRSVEVEADEYGETMKTALQISSTIKGKSKKPVVYVYHRVYRDQENQFSEGETLLLFLNRREAEGRPGAPDGYKIDDERCGLKRPSAAALAVYVQRMKELEVISKDARDDNAADVVEWLVRCAVDPATRWEGAYELAQSVRDHEDEKARKSAAPAEASEAEEMEAENSEAENSPDPAREPDLGALVTEAQKRRLMKALFETGEAGEAETDLIEMARIWKDERLVPYLVSQLRRLEADPTPFAGILVRNLGEILEEQELSSLATEYEENVSFSELEEEVESQEAEEPEEQGSIEESRAAEPIQGAEIVLSRETKIELARKARSAKLKEFLDAVEKTISRKNSKASPH